MGQITATRNLVATKVVRLAGQWELIFVSHICDTRPKWVKVISSACTWWHLGLISLMIYDLIVLSKQFFPSVSLQTAQSRPLFCLFYKSSPVRTGIKLLPHLFSIFRNYCKLYFYKDWIISSWLVCETATRHESVCTRKQTHLNVLK